MFVLNDLPPQIDPAAIDLLAGAEPATIGHFLEYGFMDPGIRALVPGRRVAGTAVTVRVSVPDAAVVHYAIGRIRPGDVLVIDRAGDQRHAVFGGYAAFAAQAAGCRAIVADGVVTDIAELRAHGMPVWARGLSTVTTKRLFQQRDAQREAMDHSIVDVLRARIAFVEQEEHLAGERGLQPVRDIAGDESLQHHRLLSPAGV